MAKAASWNERRLALLAAKLLKQLRIRGATLDIFLLPDRELAALKARFIKKKTEPNVLAFPEPRHFPHPEARRKRYLGEVYLNRSILRRQPERAAPLLAHGLLHLLGHDHKRKTETARMERLEKKLLAGL